MSKRMLYIVNLRSGKGTAGKNLADILQYYSDNGWDVTVHATTKARDAETTALEKGSDYDLVVCSGGDGTLNETISGLMNLEKRPILGYIPAGSANDNALNLNLPLDALEAAKITLNGRKFPFDIGDFNGRYFVYIAAFGALSEVSYETPQSMKNTLGHGAYILEGMKSVLKIHPVHMKIETDAGTFEDDFLFGAAANTLSIGGGVLKFDQERVDLNDGLFEVLLIKEPKNVVELGNVVRMIMAKDYSHDKVIYVKTRNLVCHSDTDVPWTVDGENGGKHRDVEIKCIYRAMTLMAGKDKKTADKIQANKK